VCRHVCLRNIFFVVGGVAVLTGGQIFYWTARNLSTRPVHRTLIHLMRTANLDRLDRLDRFPKHTRRRRMIGGGYSEIDHLAVCGGRIGIRKLSFAYF
jgi:hypothetical protein